VLVREFATPDEEMKKVVLKVVRQCVSVDGVPADYVRADILPPFFTHFWVRRNALDRRNYRAVVDTTVAVAEKVGAGDVVGRLVEDLKDDSEAYRRMALETIEKTLGALGAADVSPRLEEQLMDGLLYAFQEQGAVAGGGDDAAAAPADAAAAKGLLAGFGAVLGALGTRVKPYLPQIAGTIKWRLNNKAPGVRMAAADLVARVAPAVRLCGDDALLGHLGVVLFECLGEEFPDVLGSILGGLAAVVNVIGMHAMQPPIKDLLPRLTPILRNRHDKVQQNAIDLVGRVADRGSEFV
jgi:splicing factor 3B subunit 1